MYQVRTPKTSRLIVLQLGVYRCSLHVIGPLSICLYTYHRLEATAHIASQTPQTRAKDESVRTPSERIISSAIAESMVLGRLHLGVDMIHGVTIRPETIFRAYFLSCFSQVTSGHHIQCRTSLWPRLVPHDDASSFPLTFPQHQSRHTSREIST